MYIYIYMYDIYDMGIPKIKYRKTLETSKTVLSFSIFLTQVPALRSEVPMDEIRKKNPCDEIALPIRCDVQTF